MMPLLKAIVLPAEEAERHWCEWRATADLDRLDPRTLLHLPMLAHRFPEWLANDPSRGVLLGICKLCWSRNQVKLRELAGILDAMRQAGIESMALTGSAAWTFIHEPALRPVESLELLIAREQLAPAAGVLQRSGWTLGRDLPAGDEMDRLEAIWFDRDSEDGTGRLKLGWRMLPASPAVAADREKLVGSGTARVHGQTVSLPPSEEMLLLALAGYRDPGEIDWRCDAMQLLKSRPVDWRRLRDLLCDEPNALSRLHQLQQEWGAAIPADVFRGRGRWKTIWSDYRWIAWQRRRSRSMAGFAAYLCERWWRVWVKAR